MLTHEPTTAMIEEWKRIFAACHTKLRPNRKSGAEVDAYFRAHYPHEVFCDAGFAEVVRLNALEHGSLPDGMQPEIRCYQTGEVLVGIDLTSGFFHVESEQIEASEPVYDDLFVYRGLDDTDLQNFFLVAEYIRLTNERGNHEPE